MIFSFRNPTEKMILPQIVRDGQAVMVWRNDGTRSIVKGPAKLFAPFAKVNEINKVVAREGEYLAIDYRDGRSKHKLGPCELWLDTLEISKVLTKRTVEVAAGKAIAIYDDVDGEINYRLLLGSANYMPEPTEWHEVVNKALARESEYLVVQHIDGRTEHLVGPCELWVEKLKYTKVYTKQAIDLDAHEAVVVYDDQEGKVTHRVLNGPAVIVPKPTEWLHDFQWHGDDGTGVKVPSILKFQKLRVIPDQLYFDVDGVRTSDEALITIKLMVFFELADIEKMLQQTHDPIADFINAVTADVIRYVGSFNFEHFKLKAEALNELETFTELTNGADRIGYTVNKVVYRGYEASNKLQEMHDSAIEMRTRLVLEKETEEQQQNLTDFKQECEHSRAKQQREEGLRKQQHTLEQERLNREELLNAQKEQANLELELQRQRQQADKEHQKEMLEMKFSEWNKLHGAGADLTAILVAQEKNPDKTIRLEQSDNTQVHLHEAG